MHALEHRVLAYIKQHQLITKGDKLLVACSGGVDSMALLSFLYRFKSYFQIELAAVHVDHMLRGEASAEDRRFVEETCKKWDVPVFSCAIPIPTFLQDEGGNSQAICRRERYRYFEHIMNEYKFDKLVTAHHADDQLESLLMAITKASSLNGLKGILAKRTFGKHFIIRPFLAVTKGEIGEYLHNKRLTYREDASNQKDAYTRNRFRHHVVPLLKQENHAVSQHVVEIAQQLADDDFYLMGLAQKRFSELFEKLAQNCYKVNVSSFQSEPLALQRRLILILLSYLYNDSNTIQSYTLCTTILALFETSEGSRSLDLPENFIARRQYEIIVFEQKQQSTPMDKHEIALNEWVTIGNMRIFVGQLANCDAAILTRYSPYYFTSSAVDFPIYVRTSKPGDRIALYGMQHKKKVSRIFIDDKIPLAKRANWPLLVDAMDDLLAIVAVRTNDKFSSVKSSAHDFVLIVDSDERF